MEELKGFHPVTQEISFIRIIDFYEKTVEFMDGDCFSFEDKVKVLRPTGKRDKTGKLVHEGDLLTDNKENDDCCPVLVCWSEHECKFRLLDHEGNGKFDDLFEREDFEKELKTLEVFSNIYENSYYWKKNKED